MHVVKKKEMCISLLYTIFQWINADFCIFLFMSLIDLN